MIRLDIKDYCQKCLGFEPNMIKPPTLHANGEKISVGDTIIRCEYAQNCEHVKKCIENAGKEPK